MPLTAESTRARLYAVLEGTDGLNYGVTPANPAFSWVRNVGNTLGLSKNSLASKELKGNRMPADMRHGTRTAAGEINSEFAFSWLDPYLEATLCGTWTNPATVTAKVTLSAATGDNSFNDSGSGMPVVATDELIFVTGFANETNNGVFKVVSRTSTKIIVAANTSLVLEAVGASVKIQPMGKLTAGQTRRSWSMLRHFSDLAPSAKPFHFFKGIEFNSMMVSIKPEELVTVKFSVTGSDQVLATTNLTGATLGAANTNLPMDAFAGNVVEGIGAGAYNIGIATGIEFTLTNGIAPRYVIGSETSLQPSIADSTLTGSLTAYFDSSILLDKFLNELDSGLLVAINDPAGNTYVFEFPRIKYTDGKPDVGTGSIMLTMPWTAQEERVGGVGTSTHVRIWRAGM